MNVRKEQVLLLVRVSLLLLFLCLTALLWSFFLPPLPDTPKGKVLVQPCDSAFHRHMASAVTGRNEERNGGRAAVGITEGSDISPFN